MRPDSFRSTCERRMGSELGAFFCDIQNDVHILRRNWGEAAILFADNEIDLLNRVASNFFYRLQQLFFESAMLHLCRLTDPVKTNRGDSNLTIRRLPLLVGDGHPFKSALDTLVAGAVQKTAFARAWRNKRIAHADLNFARRGYLGVLPAVAKSDVEEAVGALNAILRAFETHYKIPPTVQAGDPWGAKALLRRLRQRK